MPHMADEHVHGVYTCDRLVYNYSSSSLQGSRRPSSGWDYFRKSKRKFGTTRHGQLSTSRASRDLNPSRTLLLLDVKLRACNGVSEDAPSGMTKGQHALVKHLDNGSGVQLPTGRSTYRPNGTGRLYSRPQTVPRFRVRLHPGLVPGPGTGRPSPARPGTPSQTVI